jgi:uncharacterized protein YkwD
MTSLKRTRSANATRHKLPVWKRTLTVFAVGLFLFLPQTAYFTSINPSKIIELSNQERGRKGQKELVANQLLTKAAYLKAQAILDAQQFDHNAGGKKFSSWIKEAGYEYSFIGENLAMDFMSSEGVVQGWLDSPSHRANLLSAEFNEIGVAVVEGMLDGKRSTIIVQVFGRPPLATIALPDIADSQSTSRRNASLLTNMKSGEGELAELQASHIPLVDNQPNNWQSSRLSAIVLDLSGKQEAALPFLLAMLAATYIYYTKKLLECSGWLKIKIPNNS